MSERFDSLGVIRHPRFQRRPEAQPCPGLPRIAPLARSITERWAVILPLVTIGLVMIMAGVIISQQFQIAHLYEQLKNAQRQQEEVASKLGTLHDNLVFTDQKTDAALGAIKRTNSQAALCQIAGLFPAGALLCAPHDDFSQPGAMNTEILIKQDNAQN